jgi:hypothetical protein
MCCDLWRACMLPTMSTTCSQCSRPLAPSGRQLPESMGVESCDACGGMLVQHRHMIPLLEALTRDRIRYLRLDEAVPAKPPRPEALPCPRCAHPMGRFGYLETNVVYLDRCDACSVVWIDGAAIDPVCLLYGRSQRARS